jgi:hypothetical protein
MARSMYDIYLETCISMRTKKQKRGKKLGTDEEPGSENAPIIERSDKIIEAS